MSEPPESLDGARVLAWAWSGEVPFGVVPGEGETIAIHGLAIGRYPGARTVYRFACDRDWEVQQDAPYGDVETAKRSLPKQYVGTVRIEWHERPG